MALLTPRITLAALLLWLRKHGRLLLAGGAALVLPVGCGMGFDPPPAPVAGRPAAEQARLNLGYETHRAKCAACHPFVNPAAYSPEKLRAEVMTEMGSKAGLSAAQRQAVLDYLLAVRRGG